MERIEELQGLIKKHKLDKLDKHIPKRVTQMDSEELVTLRKEIKGE